MDTHIKTELCERCGETCAAGWCGKCHAPTKAAREDTREDFDRIRRTRSCYRCGAPIAACACPTETDGK